MEIFEEALRRLDRNWTVTILKIFSIRMKLDYLFACRPITRLRLNNLKERRREKKELSWPSSAMMIAHTEFLLQSLNIPSDHFALKKLTQTLWGFAIMQTKNAWMTQNIFNMQLKAFDLKMENRKMLLALENCSTHVDLCQKISVRRNIKPYFLPPKTKSKIKSCDARMILNFEAWYHRCLS